MTDSSLWHGSVGGHEGRQADSGLVRRGRRGKWTQGNDMGIGTEKETEREPFFYLLFSCS